MIFYRFYGFLKVGLLLLKRVKLFSAKKKKEREKRLENGGSRLQAIF
jgi:hypothetical protein